MNLSTCVDDGAFIFKHRKNLMEGNRIIKKAMAKWGLMMHAGSVDKNLKLMFHAFHVKRKSENGEIK